MEAWVNPTTTHGIDQQRTDGVDGAYNQRFLIFPMHGDYWGNGHAGAGISVGTNGVSVYEHSAYYLPPLLVWQGTISGWTHVAVVYQDRRPSLYINGKLVAQGEQSTKSYVHPSFNIGGDVYGYFQGQIDEVRIWREARTPTQIQTWYQKALVKSSPTLIGCWHLDESTGGQTADASGYNLTGKCTLPRSISQW
jgi:hypothetical protein